MKDFIHYKLQNIIESNMSYEDAAEYLLASIEDMGMSYDRGPLPNDYKTEEE